MNKEEKRALRKEMLSLMNQDNDWHRDETTDSYKRIRKLAYLLGVDKGVNQIKKLTRCEFEDYIKKGFTMKEIALEVGVSDKELVHWRITQGYPVNLRGYIKKNDEEK